MALLKVRSLNFTNAISRSINSDDQAKFERYSDLKEKIAKLRDDLHILEMSSKAGSVQDKMIIKQLKSEIAKKSLELKTLGRVKRVYSNVEKFIENKDKDSDYDKFDYKVLQGELVATQNELKKLYEKKRELQEENSFFEIKYSSLKPSFEYLKILEGTIVQLELLKWTIVLDIQFDENLGGVRRFKRTTLAKLGIFSVMINFFMIFLGVVIRYILDKRVYNEYEISQNFKGLDIIGNTPEFD